MTHNGLLQTEELYKYILETSVYPREHESLKEIRALTATHELFFMGTSPDSAQMMEMLLEITGAKKTLEIGVYTGYSLLLTALTIPDDGKIVAIDLSREYYEIGRPTIEKARVEHKIDFIESQALPALDKLLEDCLSRKSALFSFAVRLVDEAAKSDRVFDILASPSSYEIVSLDYGADNIVSPPWLDYTGRWGPTVNAYWKEEAKMAIKFLPLPFYVKMLANEIVSKLPDELFAQEGPAGPKMTPSWNGGESE
ncbi:O-methyltransferase, family 3, S-adenosyl-L-methionine-dependent methyltransferase [Artemisia annua]|uniref:O-methyltransferase, family 3, S-adenosyl-L-methionine-dependent methyltransferase n=1 Tax=Artemisia annua TaxID=35608 RepID=A0A2U1LDF5_ARTAN|nr:O-methyltransferase, family 3, S-adenosyl-L-methionine-dependent methyltransferase [Artemisia annua]